MRKFAALVLLACCCRMAAGEGGKLTIQPPALNPSNMPCEYAWTFKIAKP